MVLRRGRFGMFIGCSRYPECEHTELIDKPDETAIACPQCGQGHLVQRRSRFGKTFHSAIAILIASSLSILNRWRANALNAITRC